MTNFKYDDENVVFLPVGSPGKETVVGMRSVESPVHEGRINLTLFIAETPEDMRDEIETGVHLTPEQLERVRTQPTVAMVFTDVEAIDRFSGLLQKIRDLYTTPEEQWGSLSDPATHVDARISLPKDFYMYRVYDLDGKEISHVVCADSEFGYLIKEIVDAKGIPILKDDEFQYEKIECEFMLKKLDKFSGRHD